MKDMRRLLHTLNASRLSALGWLVVAGAFPIMFGCVSPIALHRAVLAYDDTVQRTSSEQLLLNIVRARNYQPIHFTKVSSVAATFDFRVTAGIVPPEGDIRGLVGPVFNATVAENPTVTILPIDGEEFTTRLLTPIDETRFLKLLEIGTDLGMALRIVGGSMRLESDGPSLIAHNDPGKPVQYEEFRRRMLHLASLYETNHLYIDKVMFEEVWSGPLRELSPDDVLTALEKGFRWRQADGGRYRLSRMRVLISNYDPDGLSPEERRMLAEHLREWPPNDIMVDIRSGYPGGEYPFQGEITLRSFNSILEFLARSTASSPEYSVEQDPRTGAVQRNPPVTLEIVESEDPLPDAAVSVRYEGRHYSIKRPSGRQADEWNAKAFGMLFHLFQMMVQPINAPVPSIAIAK
jgi:hypothetical protein